MSLSTHILVQNSVGYWNYAHFTAESLGAVCGVAYVLYARSKSRRGEPTRAGDDQAADHTRAGD